MRQTFLQTFKLSSTICTYKQSFMKPTTSREIGQSNFKIDVYRRWDLIIEVEYKRPWFIRILFVQIIETSRNIQVEVLIAAFSNAALFFIEKFIIVTILPQCSHSGRQSVPTVDDALTTQQRTSACHEGLSTLLQWFKE